MDFPRLSPPHVYAGRWSAPGSPREFGGKSPPGAPKVRRKRECKNMLNMILDEITRLRASHAAEVVALHARLANTEQAMTQLPERPKEVEARVSQL
ncbi:hypothetical protein NDU88_008134 [Pleurodeles waltl]|uniref:Uncharacterized protein n=1 Tax=Pleurodeles waltl TaxID=8319 RepID=A0AAV7NWY6_PLEWA|nr:hypothetical protein NDU88_008134 [Pleurodeles waltl]